MQLGTFTWFEINKSTIVKEWCIQKDAQENTCNGNCELAKRLSITQTDSESNESSLPAIDLKLLTFVVVEWERLSTPPVSSQAVGCESTVYEELSAHLQQMIKPPMSC